jgi:putative thiazole-containing bacteriocin maturation protein
MTQLTTAARLLVGGDTFFIPVPNDGVYFRNNAGTFRMQGESIDRWIEKLIPMFNGRHSMGELTDGLSEPYRQTVYQIAETLRQKGFVRDISQDRAHQLPEEILRKYAAQIAFLDSFGDSGAFRFQTYRQASVLAVGSGPFLASLVSALLESGLPKVHVLITDSVPTNRERLQQLAEQARKTDAEAAVEEIALRPEGVPGWRAAVQPFESVLYVSQEGNAMELRLLEAACKEERKLLLPALVLEQAGMAGPLVHPESDVNWESAWRRIHRCAISKDPNVHSFSSTAGALLANVIAFELFKAIAGAGESEQRNSVYLLDLETLEGTWHPVLPHPLAGGKPAAKIEWVQDMDQRQSEGAAGSAAGGLFPYLSRLTSTQTGILHIWEEGDLKQLPLSQCRVRAVDPLSEGPAELLPDIVCSGLTHEEARREAGLAGLEAYVSRLASRILQTDRFVGVGVGESAAEGVMRGLQGCLSELFVNRHRDKFPHVVPIRLSRVEDERCRFYLQALTVMRGEPTIGTGEEVCGFPAIWVGTGDRWYGGVGLSVTQALRKALQAALLREQNSAACRGPQAPEAEMALLGRKDPADVAVPAIEQSEPAMLREALDVLQRNGKHVKIADLAVEPFLKEASKAVYGIVLDEGESK